MKCSIWSIFIFFKALNLFLKVDSQITSNHKMETALEIVLHKLLGETSSSTRIFSGHVHTQKNRYLC